MKKNIIQLRSTSLQTVSKDLKTEAKAQPVNSILEDIEEVLVICKAIVGGQGRPDQIVHLSKGDVVIVTGPSFIVAKNAVGKESF